MKIELINSTFRNLIVENSSLSSYLVNLNRGRPATPRSWLYEDQSAEDVLAKWTKILVQANSKSPFADEFNQFDLKQVEKFGPQGHVPPISDPKAQEVIERLFISDEYDDSEALSRYFTSAHEFAKVLFGQRLCTKRPISFDQVKDDMLERDTLSTNSGFPRFIRRKRAWKEEVQDAMSGKAFEYPAIILFRQYNGKLRPVWMYPMSMNLLEFTFTQPIQRALRNSPTARVRQYLSPWEGYETVKATLTQQWKNQVIVGGDTDTMDAHMKPAQMRLVYEIVKRLFQKKYWDQLWKIMARVNSIPLLISPTEMVVGTHGLASGAGWTQLSETVLQLFMAWYASTYGQGIGDDLIWLINWDDKQIVDYLGQFGLPANAKKQWISSVSTHFLQRMNHQGFFSRDNPAVLGGYYPTVRALNSLLNPEKYHSPKQWNKYMFCVRTYMILENCIDDPCFDEFLKFVVKGQSDLIPFAKMQPELIDKYQRQARLIPGLNPSYNQEKLTKPLSSFTSIKLAKQM
nr:MAG: RNA-dependent RNA polymerase [Porcine picobirnavirus]